MARLVRWASSMGDEDVAAVIADPQIRYRGTLGGNVANGDPGNDMPAVMMTLDATYVLAGPGGERSVKARDFYQGAYFTAAEDGELLVAVRIPAPPAGAGWFERLPFAWYLEAYGADTASTDDAEAVGERVQGERPPVVITFGPSETCSEEYHNAEDIQQYMDGYERHEVDRFLHDSGCIVSSVVVYVDEDAASGQAGAQDGSGSLARPTTGDAAVATAR